MIRFVGWREIGFFGRADGLWRNLAPFQDCAFCWNFILGWIMVRSVDCQIFIKIYLSRFCARVATRPEGLVKSQLRSISFHDTIPPFTVISSTSTNGFSKTVWYILPKLAVRLGMIMNSARGDLYPILWSGCRGTDGPVIAAEARIREFGSSGSNKRDAVFEKILKNGKSREKKTKVGLNRCKIKIHLARKILFFETKFFEWFFSDPPWPSW